MARTSGLEHRIRWERRALAFGASTPLLYFGTQAIAARGTPGYSVIRQPASDLGIAGSAMAALFNIGALCTGAACLGAAFGMYTALRRRATGTGRTTLACLAVASCGVGAIAAGWFPLPDARHGGGAFGAGIFAVPLLLALCAGSESDTLRRRYFRVNLALFIVSGLCLSGATGLDANRYAGLFQRLLAVTVFVPVGVLCARLWRQSSVRPQR